jgi:hypothetical protein
MEQVELYRDRWIVAREQLEAVKAENVRLAKERDDARLCARVLWDYIEDHDCPLTMNHWAERWPWLEEE